MTERISDFKVSQRNYPELIRNALRDCAPEHANYVFVGVDEGLNDPRIFRMLEGLIAGGTIRSAGPLWRAVHVLSDGSRSYAYGGVTRRNKRILNVVMGEMGERVRETSDDDSSILDFLVGHFLSFGKVVFLTADKTFDVRGEYFSPLLSEHRPPLSLTAIYKGNVEIEPYCAEVERFLKVAEFKAGYAEIRTQD